MQLRTQHYNLVHRSSHRSSYTYMHIRLTLHITRSMPYSLPGSNRRPMAHRTIALTTELRELLCRFLIVAKYANTFGYRSPMQCIAAQFKRTGHMNQSLPQSSPWAIQIDVRFPYFANVNGETPPSKRAKFVLS